MKRTCEEIVISILIIGLAVELALLLLALWQLRQLRLRFSQALGGREGSIEDVLVGHHQLVTTVDQKLDDLNAAYKQLSTVAGLASQKISLVRFNPFGDTGGDQSFALAVLDAHDSGYVLTSIHGREGTRVYIKPIDFGQSKYTLSKEEQQAIAQASKRTAQ